jgi:hypothetical protein
MESVKTGMHLSAKQPPFVAFALKSKLDLKDASKAPPDLESSDIVSINRACIIFPFFNRSLNVKGLDGMVLGATASTGVHFERLR